MAKALSSVDSRGKAVDQLVASLESGHAKQSTKIKKLEKLADKHDTEQVCIRVFQNSFFFKLNSGNLAIAVDIHQDSPKKF